MLLARTGRITFNCSCPFPPHQLIVLQFPITFATIIVKLSHWVGLILPGMIDDPGSFEGKTNSPTPPLGPEPSNLTSLAILLILEKKQKGKEERNLKMC